ncbi:hypothetical protein M0804_009261 [Polistes exclamans]|nr:hypothetical protein M0804_009261 [Polistes exclamans]
MSVDTRVARSRPNGSMSEEASKNPCLVWCSRVRRVSGEVVVVYCQRNKELFSRWLKQGQSLSQYRSKIILLDFDIIRYRISDKQRRRRRLRRRRRRLLRQEEEEEEVVVKEEKEEEEEEEKKVVEKKNKENNTTTTKKKTWGQLFNVLASAVTKSPSPTPPLFNCIITSVSKATKCREPLWQVPREKPAEKRDRRKSWRRRRRKRREEEEQYWETRGRFLPTATAYQ